MTDDPVDVPAAAGTAPELAAPTPPSGPPAPIVGGAEQTGYQFRFGMVYAALGVLLVGASAGLLVLALQPAPPPVPAWSAWAPVPGTVSNMSNQIANHVSHAYRLNTSGAQLVAVVPSKMTVTSGTTNIAIKAIAIRKKASSNAGIQVLTGSDVTSSEMFTFCGLGSHCSISAGKATAIRGRLVRREALEVALYTFKFVPSIKSVIAFMPPAPGTTTSPLIFLRKQNLTDVLKKPLRTILPLAIPPLPTDSDVTEASTIDQLTLPNVFNYSLQALQTGGAAFVLDPLPT